MMHRYFLFLCCIIFLCPSLLLAQEKTAIVRGKVSTKQGGSLPGITVMLEDTDQGAATDDKGRYEIKGITPGNYKLVISGIGYSRQIHYITLRAGQLLKLNILMTEDIHRLEEIVVKGKSEANRIEEQAYAVEAIETKKLQNRNVDMNQLLTQSAGIRVRESGGLGSSFSYSINGMNGRAIKFFVDGIPIDRYGSGYSINNFPVNLIDRIEIYKGVLPASFGSDALGGAVNIISKAGYQNYIDASYSIGSFNTHRASLAAHWANPADGFFADLQGFYNYSDNNYEVWGPGVEVANPETGRAEGIRTERFHDAYRSASVKAEVGLREKSWADQLKLGFLFADNFNELQHGATMASVIGEATRTEESWAPSLQYQKNNFLFERMEVNLFSSYSYLESITIDTSSRIYNWLGQVIDERPTNSEMGGGRNGKSLLTLRTHNFFNQAIINYNLSPVQKFTLTYTLDDTERSGSDPLISNRTASFKEPQRLTKQVAAFSFETKAFNEKWDHTLWVKNYNFDVSTVDEKFITDSLGYRPVAFPIDDQLNSTGFGYASKYSFNDRHLVKLSIERAFRLPDPDEILGDALFIRNNPQLRPEESINLNLSWMAKGLSLGSSGSLSLEPSFFYRNTQDLILFIANENRGTGIFENIGKVRGLGGSLDVTYQYQDFLQLKANATYQDLRDWNEFEGPNRNQTYRDRLRNTPYMMANAGLNILQKDFFNPKDQITFFWDVQYVHEFYLNWPSLGARDSKAIIPSQLINSAGIGYSIRSGIYNFSLQCNNIFDEQVYDNYLLQRPGRAFAMKFRMFLSQI